MFNKFKVALVVTVCGLAFFAGQAHADYRSGNSWMAATPGMQAAIAKNSSFRGYATGYVYKDARRVKCVGDRTGQYEVDRAHGYYHHFWCWATLWDTNAWVLFDAWQIGSASSNFRLSDVVTH